VKPAFFVKPHEDNVIQDVCERLRKALAGQFKLGFERDLDALLKARGRELWVIGIDSQKRELVDICGTIVSEAVRQQDPPYLCGGATATPGLLRALERTGHKDAMIAGLIEQSPLGRMAEPDDIVDVALFLASDASRSMTGSEIFADGGMAQV
jgi:hypothetical protein